MRHSRLSLFHLLDIRHAFRLLRRSPVFALLTVGVLAGGLGLAIFTFSFLYTAMLKPLPLNEGDRIVRVMQASLNSSGGIDAADLAHMRGSIASLSAVGAYETRSATLGDVEHPHPIQVTVAESNIFEVTRSAPLLGRGLRPDDQLPGAEPVIVLGYSRWNAVFGGDSALVGRTVELDGAQVRLVGVMPAGYGFPVASESWRPLSDDVLTTRVRDIASFNLYARLAPGVNATQAANELSLLLSQSRTDIPLPARDAAVPARVTVETFPMAQMGEDGPLMFTVLNTVAFLILLLSCINVTNLLLARANERARETAVRLALGASRARLIMQNMWESIILCLAGGALATALAAWGLDAINALAHANLEGNLAFWWVWRLDRTGLLTAAAFVTGTMAVLGAVVAARASNQQVSAVLGDGGARSGGRRQDRVARALVVTQVATVSLLMFFGILSGGVAHRIANVDFGYDTRRLLAAPVDVPSATATTAAGRSQFYRESLRGLEQSPAIESTLLQAGVAAIGDEAGAFEIEGRAAGGSFRPRSYVQGVLGSLGTLGIVVRNGRPFDARDDERGLGTAIVSQALATKYWPTSSALGARIRLAGDSLARTVVGVASDVLLGNPISRNRSALAVYVPLLQTATARPVILFRHHGDLAAAQAALYRTLRAADRLVVPPSISTYDDILAKTTMMARFVVRLFTFCFGFALLLAVSGTYGLMARSIGRRTREIGVRRALGASERDVVRLLLHQGTRQLGVGVLLALPPMALVAWGFAQFLPIGLVLSMGTGALVSAAIVSVVLLATWIPTRRALGVPLREALGSD